MILNRKIENNYKDIDSFILNVKPKNTHQYWIVDKIELISDLFRGKLYLVKYLIKIHPEQIIHIICMLWYGMVIKYSKIKCRIFGDGI